MIDNKYKFTGDIDSITFKGGNPLDAYLPDSTKLQVQDMGNYYAYSNGQNIWRIPKSKFEGEQQKKGPAEDIDKVMLGTLAMGLGPIALPELFGPLVTNIVNNPQMWGQALQRTAAGMAGYEGVNEINKAVNNETWGEGVNRLSKGKVPVWLGDLTNPGGFLEGVVTRGGNKLLNTIENYAGQKSAPRQYLQFNDNAMYRIIGQEGYEDAIANKVLRPNMNPNSKYYRGINKYWNWFTKGHPNDHKHPVRYSNGFKPMDAVYPGDIIVEVLPEHPQYGSFKQHYTKPPYDASQIYKTNLQISTESPFVKFYKRDKHGKYYQIENPTFNNYQDTIRYFSTAPVTRFEGTQETSIHPLEARLARLREKVREGVIPETKQLGLIGKDLTPMDIKSALIELDPTLTDKQLQGAIQVAMAKKQGVHIPFGTETTTDAGLSIVDIADAVRLLKKHHITNPTSKDIENIIAHEFGHSTAYEIPEDVRPLLEGYYDPNEFFTQAGQILDNAGIKETVNNPVSYKDFMDMLAQYQSQGNLDNGISQLADFMKQFSATSGNRWKDASTIVKRNQLMKYINRLSAGLYGAYLLRNKNGKTQQ